VEYSKDGKILSQFWNTLISNITDFTVDEQSKTVYLLSKGNQIQKFSSE
jgi:preprotein translocase subunit SecA